MEIVLQVETKDYQKLRDILLKDDTASRASIVFKEGSIVSKKNCYYCHIAGTEEQCKKALELTKELVREVKDKEKEEIINKIKEEEKRAIEGFGDILG